MASRDNFKSMYKAKHKEESSTSSRRKSRGLERQKLRDDEVNKRRLLSVSDMSPVFEDKKEETKGTQVKASNRLERLKQWREERKKKQEEAKKNAKKPMFKVTHLEYKEELQLFNKERSGAKNEQKISGQPVGLSSHPIKPIAKQAATQRIVSNVKASKVETTKETTKEVNMDRKNRLVTKATKLENKKAAHNERTRSTVKATRPSENNERKTRSGTKETNLIEKVSATVSLDKNNLDKDIETKRNPRKIKNQTAQYCKPTTAAAAKSTNEKHTNFLRSKSHQVGTNKSKGNTKALKDKETEDVKVLALDNTPLRKKSVRLNVGAVAASSASESEQDLHLSDSNVSLPKHSTPRPARGSDRYSSGSRRKYKKTPGIKTNKARLRSQKKSVRDLSPIDTNVKIKQDKSANLESDDSTNEDSDVSSENKEVNISNISDKENMQTASSRLVGRSSKRSHIKDSKELSGENIGVESSQKFTPKKKLSLENTSTPTHGSSTRKTRSQLNLGFKPSPAKRSRSAMASPENDQDAQSGKHQEKSAKRARFTTLKSPSSDEENLNIISHEVQEPDPDLPNDVVLNVFVTRKSLRVASLISDNDMANNPEKKSLTPKKRKSMRASTRKSRSQSRRRSQSIVVSVSDEGTIGALGDSIGQIQSAPENHYKVEVVPHNTPGGSNVKSIKSDFIDVSDEGTALVSEQNSSVVYQVIKSEGSSRALQELTVAKIDGEISFIEVPLEESVNVLPRLSHSSEDNHSTQPFSPTKSNDVSQSSPSVHLSPKAAYSQVVAEQNSDSISASQGTPVTFRTLRRRAHSIAPTFKTPNATKSKKERKRRKTDHVLKSPEEMVKILSQSPLVEMSRRRRKSKFVLSSDEITESEPASVTSDNTTPIQQQDIVQFNDLKVNEEKMERVNYYKNLVKSETQRLNELGDKWTAYLHHSTDVGEDAQGQIRSTVGKSQLLIDQRFKQFTGLINDCEFNLGEKETTPTDLQGFWEMIYCQVEDVDKLFSNLTELEQNNWQIKQPTPKNVPKKKVVTRAAKPKVKSNFAAFRQEMMKRKAKDTALDTSIDLATVDSEKNKVFDAGFFKVSSPIRSYSGLGSKKTTPVIDTNENSTQQTDISEAESQTPKREIKSSATTPMSLNNKENKVLATPVNRLLSAKRKSYLPAVPSPLLNDITGLRAKK